MNDTNTIADYSDYLPDIVSTNVISIIGFGISILLLCTHLIVYSITEEMQTLTGNCLASFCFSLLLSYCTYIGGMILEHGSVPCTVIAIITYYFFLTNSSWLLSISLELYGAARQTKYEYQRNHANNKNSTCKFIKYSVFSWLEPALAVGAAFYLESNDVLKMPKNFQVDLFPVGSNCFNKSTSMLLWFLVFFNCNLILTFLVSAFTAFLACGTHNYHIQKNQDFFAVLKYYMRMSLLVGFTWILGMCMIRFKGAVLHIGFALSNGVLGLYIFLVFTFNNKLSSVIFYEDKNYKLDTFHGNVASEQEIVSVSSTVPHRVITSDV